jgi:predicted CXXCH cytochrome family protein
MKKEKAHPPAASDCLTCHKPHYSGERTLLAQPLKDMCSQCHDLKDEAFSKAHIGIDPDVIDCRKCHDPHASKDAHFFKDIIHSPFDARTCEECHVVGGKK